MYLGQVYKGIALLASAIILNLVTMGITGIAIGGIPIWIIAMIDANKIGKKIEAGQSVGEWEFF